MRVFGPVREEVSGGEASYFLLFTKYQEGWEWQDISLHGYEKCVQKFIKPEGKKPLGRFRCRWEVNIKLDF